MRTRHHSASPHTHIHGAPAHNVKIGEEFSWNCAGNGGIVSPVLRLVERLCRFLWLKSASVEVGNDKLFVFVSAAFAWRPDVPVFGAVTRLDGKKG